MLIAVDAKLSGLLIQRSLVLNKPDVVDRVVLNYTSLSGKSVFVCCMAAPNEFLVCT